MGVLLRERTHNQKATVSRRLKILNNVRQYNVDWLMDPTIGAIKTDRLIRVVGSLNNRIESNGDETFKRNFNRWKKESRK